MSEGEGEHFDDMADMFDMGLTGGQSGGREGAQGDDYELKDDLPALRQAIADGYEIDPDGKLGEGGSAVVYAAEHRQTRVPVAIKAVKTTDKLDAQTGEAILREEFAIVRDHLDGLDVAKALDFGGKGETAYAVFEWVDAQSVLIWAARHAPARSQRLALAEKILETLASIHATGVVHGDLKPDHLLTRRGQKVICLDFGLAYLAGSKPGITHTQSMTGATMGLAAPEQVDGESFNRGSMPADVYTVGKILGDLFEGIKLQAWCQQTLDAMTASHPDERPEHAGQALSMWRRKRQAARNANQRWWASRGLAVVVLLVAVVGAFGVWVGRPGQYPSIFRKLLPKLAPEPIQIHGGAVPNQVLWPLENSTGLQADLAWQSLDGPEGSGPGYPIAQRRLAVFDTESIQDPSAGIAYEVSPGGDSLLAWVEDRNRLRVFDESTGQRWQWQCEVAIKRVFVSVESTDTQPVQLNLVGVVHINGAVTLFRLDTGLVAARARVSDGGVVDAAIMDGTLWLTTRKDADRDWQQRLFSASLEVLTKDRGTRELSLKPEFVTQQPNLGFFRGRGSASGRPPMALELDPAGYTRLFAPGPDGRFPAEAPPWVLETTNTDGKFIQAGDRWAVWFDFGVEIESPPMMTIFDASAQRHRRQRLPFAVAIGEPRALAEDREVLFVAAWNQIVAIDLVSSQVVAQWPVWGATDAQKQGCLHWDPSEQILSWSGLEGVWQWRFASASP